MAKAKSWSVKGIDGATRDRARAAAQAAGLPIGAWIDQAILRAKAGEFPELSSTTNAPPGQTAVAETAPTETTALPEETAPAGGGVAETPPVEAPLQDAGREPVSPEKEAEEAPPRRPIVADPDVRVSRPAASNDDIPP